MKTPDEHIPRIVRQPRAQAPPARLDVSNSFIPPLVDHKAAIPWFVRVADDVVATKVSFDLLLLGPSTARRSSGLLQWHKFVPILGGSQHIRLLVKAEPNASQAASGGTSASS